MANTSEEFDNAHTIFLGRSSAGDGGRELKPGTIIGGNYKLLSLLGRGGMGYVFRVEHTGMGRHYALKILAPEQSDPESRQRFEIEGRAIATMDHPNIVKVYDMGLDKGDCPYYVMDLLKGVSLTDYLKSKLEMTLLEYLEICIHIASGLAYAHSKGVVHRDVKPSNVVLLAESHDGSVVKIVDFGIAKLLPTATLANQSQTATGLVFGSPPYMSPEHCMGKPVDARSDIYALGCTFYEMLCGQPPYMGRNAVATMLMHQTEPVPVVSRSSSLDDLPRSVDLLVAKMMAKNVDERYQTMQQVIHDLERIKQGKSVGRSETVEYATSPYLVSAGVSKNYEGPLLEGDDDRPLEYEQSPEPIDRRILAAIIGGSICAAVAIIGGGAYFLSQPKTVVLEPQKDISSHVDDTNPQERFHRIYRFAGEIHSSPAVKDGLPKRKFVFPEASIGRILAEGYKPVECKSESYAPAGVPLTLLIGKGESAGVFYCPDVIKKIGPDEFEHLLIVGCGSRETDRLVLMSHQSGTADILAAAAKWTKLQTVGLQSMALDSEIFAKLNDTKNLKYLALTDCAFNSAELVDQPFWGRLSKVSLDNIADCSPLFKSLGHSSRLNTLRIKNCPVTTADIAYLVTAPNLFQIDIDEKNGAELVPALLKLPRLREVRIRSCTLTIGQIEMLVDSPHIARILLQKKAYSAVEREQARAIDLQKVVFESY